MSARIAQNILNKKAHGCRDHELLYWQLKCIILKTNEMLFTGIKRSRKMHYIWKKRNIMQNNLFYPKLVYHEQIGVLCPLSFVGFWTNNQFEESSRSWKFFTKRRAITSAANIIRGTYSTQSFCPSTIPTTRNIYVYFNTRTSIRLRMAHFRKTTEYNAHAPLFLG